MQINFHRLKGTVGSKCFLSICLQESLPNILLQNSKQKKVIASTYAWIKIDFFRFYWKIVENCIKNVGMRQIGVNLKSSRGNHCQPSYCENSIVDCSLLFKGSTKKISDNNGPNGNRNWPNWSDYLQLLTTLNIH